MKIKFKKLGTAETPKYAKDGDAGMDMWATSIQVTDDYIEYGTNIAVEIPYGYAGLMFPRSSISKKDLLLCNSVGVVDSGYRGEIKFRFKATDARLDNIYEIGERVGQLIVMPVPTVELEEVFQLSDSERGEDGFGSTNERKNV